MASATEPEDEGLIRRIDRYFDRVITGWNPYHPDKLKERGLEPVAIEESPVRRKGTILIVGAAAMFVVWSVTAPLNAGSTAPGTVIVAGYRKAVQHPSGGVVTRVLVSEGEKVRQGQILLTVNPLENDANVASLAQEYITLLASEARARAELMGSTIRWPDELAKLQKLLPERVAEARSIQLRLFQMRQAQYSEQQRALSSQISGLSGTIAAHQVQLDTLSQEYTSVEKLAKEGYVPQQQVNTTLRNRVDQEAALSNARAETGKIRAQIAELRSQFQAEVAKELAEHQKNRESVGARLQAARFLQSLSEIRAPVAGSVVNLKVFTEGGVINSGEVLMEIVPDQGRLIIEAKVAPSSIDSVKVGQEADVRFTAFNATTTPVVKGVVKAVGVDKLKAKPGEEVRETEDYYLVQVETSPDALRALGDKQLRPGMPADVLINRGQRTFMSYLLKPMTDKLSKAFRD